MTDPTTETFQPVTAPSPDWNAASNWSGGVVPGMGVMATIAGLTASVDPDTIIDTSLALETAAGHDAALVGNGGAVALGSGAAISVSGAAALYASDSVVNQGHIAIDGGSALNVVVDLGAVSGLAGAAPPSFANDGAIAIGASGALEIGGTEFENAGLVTLSGGTLDVAGGALAGGGTIALAAGAMARFGDGVADQSFVFGAGGGTLVLEDALLGGGIAVQGFAGGDTIALPDLAGARIAQTGREVELFDAAGRLDGSFVLGGATSLAITAVGGGSAIIASPLVGSIADPPCFASGTRILTPAGYRPVEVLAPGDAVITAAGQVRHVRWVGLRMLDLAEHHSPAKVLPIRLRPGALGPGVPRRALRLSPDHALWLDGALVPVRLLVNEATIVRETDCLAVIYHHVELDRHDILLAEGAPCESYLDTGNRGGFANVHAWPVRPKRWDRDACAPLLTTGAALHAIRAQLHRRALDCGFRLDRADTVTLWVDGRKAEGDAATGFTLPPEHDGRAVIRSARFVPAAIDPASEDRRELGIALAWVKAGRRRYIPESLALAGFHPRAMGDAALWTDSAGTIRVPRGARRIAFTIVGGPLAWRAVSPGRLPVS